MLPAGDTSIYSKSEHHISILELFIAKGAERVFLVVKQHLNLISNV